MIFKIIAFLAAAIPIFLFVRSIFFRRTTRINEGLSEFKKQANLAVSIFLFLIVCVVVFAAGTVGLDAADGRRLHPRAGGYCEIVIGAERDVLARLGGCCAICMAMSMMKR